MEELSDNVASTPATSTISRPPTILVKVLKGGARETEKRFSSSFVIGRGKECDFQIMETSASRAHLKVILDCGHCVLKDLSSANGTFVQGVRTDELLLTGDVEVELGKGGALLCLSLEQVDPKVESETKPGPDFASETQIIRHYFGKKHDEDAGLQTMMFRRAFDRVQKKKSRKYKIILALALVVILAGGAVIFAQRQKINKLRATAENIFYTTKALSLQISKMEEAVLVKADPSQIADLKAKRLKLREMEKEYEGFVKELGLYNKVPEDEQIMLRVARTFGECDVNVPKGFVDEVKRYIKGWKSTDRLPRALQRAHSKGYERLITRVMKDNNLPPQYLFLALQESGFDERAVGPPTRYGHAKGMWQFISDTAVRYGLQVGPYRDSPAYDPVDDRFDPVKSTMAAMRYIKELNNTEGQASGLLVMASYNWGESNIREIIRRMPENPKERNFWRLLSYKDIPKETYDYVFSIFSAAVICENPRLFEVNVQCPQLGGS